MKKWIIGILVIVTVSCVSIFMIIPSTLRVSKNVLIDCTSNGAGRYLLDKSKWVRWWPLTTNNKPGSTAGNHAFRYNGYAYRINQFFYNRISLDIQKNEHTVTSNLNMIPIHQDSILLVWDCTLKTSMNPFKRILDYIQAREIKRNMGGILDSLQQFLGKRENVYGIHIRKERFRDSTLIATRALFTNYPGTNDIYRMINDLQEYISSQGARKTNYPMLNVTDSGTNRFFTMVAIPTDRRLKNHGNVNSLRFFDTEILVTEVTGGPLTIQNGYAQMMHFINDYRITSPAKPFETLVTNRLHEPDTSKWITRIYFPAFLKPGILTTSYATEKIMVDP